VCREDSGVPKHEEMVRDLVGDVVNGIFRERFGGDLEPPTSVVVNVVEHN
jgi:hypothetical protein